MRALLLLAACTLAALFAARPGRAEPSTEPIAGNSVLELFTSQGCSSCPPADALLAELAEKPGIVALSYSVDYWNYLGWRDTLSSAANSDRQREYAKARGDGRVYTPQIVVDGLLHVVGSDENAVEQAMQAAAKRLANVRVPVSMHGDGDTLVINVGAAPEASYAREATIWLAIAKEQETVSISSRRESRAHSELPPSRARAVSGRHVEGRGDDVAPSTERPEGHGRAIASSRWCRSRTMDRCSAPPSTRSLPRAADQAQSFTRIPQSDSVPPKNKRVGEPTRLHILGNEVARSERRPRGGWGAEIRSLSIGPGREATMMIIRFFGARQCLNLGVTVIYVS